MRHFELLGALVTWKGTLHKIVDCGTPYQ